MTNQEKRALVKWMHEVTSSICYQPEIPISHKDDICKALESFCLLPSTIEGENGKEVQGE